MSLCLLAALLVIASCQWKLTGEITPQATQGMCFAVVQATDGATLVGFGGRNPTTSQFSNQITLINLDSYSKTSRSASTSSWPSSRANSCCCGYNSTYYLYGGTTQAGTRLSELWQFELSTGKWAKLSLRAGASLKTDRANCSMVCSSTKLWVLGDQQQAYSAHQLLIDLTQLRVTPFQVMANSPVLVKNVLWDNTTETVQLSTSTASAVELISPIASAVSQSQVLVQCSTQMTYLVNLSANSATLVATMATGCLPVTVTIGTLAICPDDILVAHSAYSTYPMSNLTHKNVGNWPANLTYLVALNSSQDILLIGYNSNALLLYMLPKESCIGSFSQCWYGWAICQSGYYGTHCSDPLCPNSVVLYDKHAITSHSFLCGGRGACSSGLCQCYSSFGGKGCESYTKPSCRDSVVQDYPLSICECACNITGGINCQVKFCYNDCTKNGVCSSEGVCSCLPNYSGADCSVLKIPILFNWADSSGVLVALLLLALIC